MDTVDRNNRERWRTTEVEKITVLRGSLVPVLHILATPCTLCMSGAWRVGWDEQLIICSNFLNDLILQIKGPEKLSAVLFLFRSIVINPNLCLCSSGNLCISLTQLSPCLPQIECIYFCVCISVCVFLWAMLCCAVQATWRAKGSSSGVKRGLQISHVA